MFRRKLKLSSLAMSCGWIACNIAWWVGYSTCPTRQASASMPLLVFLQIGLCTQIVIFLAWLFVFLPLDVVVPDASPWRRPRAAALYGFLASFALAVLFFVSVFRDHITTIGFLNAIRNSFDMGALPFLLGTCTAGTVAAWSRALMDNPKQNQTP